MSVPNLSLPWSPIFDQKAKYLISKCTETPAPRSFHELIAHLTERCKNPLVRARYSADILHPLPASPYPLDPEGYAISFDPVTEERGFSECWAERGIVAGRTVVSKRIRESAVSRMNEILFDLCDGGNSCGIPFDENGVPFVSRGFLELYHDAVLADIRQSLQLYLHHVAIWGRTDLWTSFDRVGLKFPGHADAAALPLHVDQNPRVHPDFRTIQGVVALEDCPAEKGTFVGAAGSRALFSGYGEFAPERGEYVELPPKHRIRDAIDPRPLPLRAGDIVTWDSRTTHANSANHSGESRYVAYVAAGPARESDWAAVSARSDAFRTGVGANVRDALMHASKKPRYTAPALLSANRQPEDLTVLGRLLYGIDRWDTCGVAP